MALTELLAERKVLIDLRFFHGTVWTVFKGSKLQTTVGFMHTVHDVSSLAHSHMLKVFPYFHTHTHTFEMKRNSAASLYPTYIQSQTKSERLKKSFSTSEE